MDTTRPSLLLRIRDPSDRAAWRTFDGIYRPMIYRFAQSMGLVHADCEDVTQQCMAVIAGKIAEFTYDPKRGRFKGWLRTMVQNRVRNHIRDRKDVSVRTGDFQRIQEREQNPDDIFEQIWMQEHLWHCLREVRAEVDEKTYHAFTGYVIEQRPASDVAAELDLSTANLYTIKWRMTERVAAKMKELLDGTG